MARRRKTVARHARLGAPSIVRQLFTLVAVAVAVVLVAGAGTVAYSTYDLASTFTEDAVVTDQQVPVPPDIGEIEGGVNLLVTGIDQCEEKYRDLFGARCNGPDAETQLNDVNMLLHISDNPRRVTVVSFPRDLIFTAPGCTRTNGTEWAGGSIQINETFELGGLNCVIDSIEGLSGVDVQFAATVTFGGVIEITDAIGGVEICLDKGMRDSNTGIDWPAGNRTIQGIDALQFLRTRYGVGGSDLARISNQQQYMSRLARKLVSEEVLTNPATLYRLASSTLRSVTPTDTLTNPLTLVQIALAVRDVPFEDIVFVQYPSVQAASDANRVQPNYTAAEQLWTALDENKPLELTGAVGANGGVVEVTPEETAAPEAPEATPDPTATTPTDAATLPPSITGSTAAQETCSSGNLSR
ncbi:LCP family protein [Microbacterium sp. P06]|uniref:LCP family protein n=1 Tax=Microbacterium sp. P06 TaxID=3366949 RepID=UPI0037461F06